MEVLVREDYTFRTAGSAARVEDHGGGGGGDTLRDYLTLTFAAGDFILKDVDINPEPRDDLVEVRGDEDEGSPGVPEVV